MPKEEERKYDVGSSFQLPDLSSLAAEVTLKPAKTLTATYYDTADLRLVRSGASLRFREGDDLPWTVKLPTDTPGVRHEISRPGSAPGKPPQELVWLVAGLTRGAPLKKVAVVTSRRVGYDLRSAKGRVLAELVDDHVTTANGGFREIEVERKAGSGRLLSTVEERLLAAGAVPASYPSKVAHALGEAALRAPDAVNGHAGDGDAGDVVDRAIRAGVKRLLDHDPLVRLEEPLPNGDTAVHQMRVACRRLRSDLRTFSPLLREAWARPLRTELGWLAEMLGAARDAEVLRARLRSTAGADPLAPMDTVAIERIDGVLARRQADALRTLGESLRSGRYLALLDALVAATRQQARKKGSLHGLANEPTQRLCASLGKLEASGADADWHHVRILTKRARYAVEAQEGHRDPLARAMADLQDLLGEHQDAAVAGTTWLSFGIEPALSVTAGRLYERERAAVRAARAQLLTIAPQLLSKADALVQRT